MFTRTLDTPNPWRETREIINPKEEGSQNINEWKNPRRASVRAETLTCINIYYTSCDTRAFHGSTILFIHFKPAFSERLFSPVVSCNRSTCVHVCHSSFAFLLVLEFTPFPFSFSHLTHDLTQGENSLRLWRIFRVGHIRT